MASLGDPLCWAFWVSAVLHAMVHIGGHEVLELAKVKVSKRLLHNHDVQKALAESTGIALRMIQDKYKASNPGREQFKQARRVFDDLTAQKEQLFAIGSDYDKDLLVPLQENHASKMVDSLLALTSNIPKDVEAIIRLHFPGSFVYAFKEIGLKRNSHVRTVVTNELLLALGSDVKAIGARLDQLDVILEQEEEVVRFQQEFKEYTGERFDDLVDRIEAVQRVQERIVSTLERQSGASSVRPIGRLAVSSLDGYRILVANLTGREVTVGRHPENRILLPDPSISNHHAVIRIQGDCLTIRDLASKNGTLLNGDRISGEQAFTYGDEITIGSYVLEVSPITEESVDPVLPTL